MTMHPVCLLFLAAIAAVCLWFGRGPRDNPEGELSTAENKSNEAKNDEEMANAAITLCRTTDMMLATYIEKKDNEFDSQGGIRERLTAARIGCRTDRRDELQRLRAENAALKERIKQMEHLLSNSPR